MLAVTSAVFIAIIALIVMLQRCYLAELQALVLGGRVEAGRVDRGGALRWFVLKKTFLLLALFLCGFASAADSPYRIIGYVRSRTDFSRIGAKKLTHINYAFAQVSTSGEIVFASKNSGERLRELMKIKRRNPKLKILLSVGGWGADNFSDAALTDASRRKFADSAMAMIAKYSLDGIDLDWEYPGQGTSGIKFRAEDKQNFTALLKTMRERLGNKYLLTIATAGDRYFAQTEMDKLHVYVDWMNVMTYDFFNAGTKTTGHHTPLLRNPWSPYQLSSTDTVIQQHLNAGIPRDKLVIGAAFYGRGWTGVNPEGNGLFQPFERYEADHPYPDLEKNYINKNGFKRYWDATARAAYLWNEKTRTFISYDDPEALAAKAAYVKNMHLGGVMYWEESHDPDETLLDVLVKGLR